jgi:hypothetical protein
LHRGQIASDAAHFGIGRWCGAAEFFGGGTRAPQRGRLRRENHAPSKKISRK